MGRGTALAIASRCISCRQSARRRGYGPVLARGVVIILACSRSVYCFGRPPCVHRPGALSLPRLWR